MSNIVITSSGNELTAQFDKRFGRAEWFCVLDSMTKESRFIKNEFTDSNHGAGTKVAELMIELKVDKIISGDFGPKAKELLEKVNIQMVILQDSTTIKEIVDRIVV